MFETAQECKTEPLKEWLRGSFNQRMTSWFEKVVDQSRFANYSFGTGSRWGILYSIDSDHLSEKRIVCELNKEHDRIALLEVLSVKEPILYELKEIAEDLEKKGLGALFEYGIGITGSGDAWSITTYIGSDKRGNEKLLAEVLSKTDIWFPRPRAEAIRLLERAQMVSELVGLAKRLGKRNGWMLYYASRNQNLQTVIAYILEPLGEEVINKLRSLLAADGIEAGGGSPVFGWGFGLDEDGNCAYIKLEISKGIDHGKVIENDKGLLDATNELKKICLGHGLEAAPQISSYRIKKDKISRTVYFNIRSGDEYEDAYEDYKEKVISYYEKVSKLLQELEVATYQAGLIKTEGEERVRESNLFLAKRAGLRNGQKVLDAGCGLGGPMIDIAEAYPGASIYGITNSPTQKTIAERAAKKNGKVSIDVRCGDYHMMPYDSCFFDRVLFFESIGYSYDPDALFAEVNRVLKKGGEIYIKDVFCKEGRLTGEEQNDLDAFNEVFCQYSTTTLSEITARLQANGFRIIEVNDLSEMVSIEKFIAQMFEKNEPERLNAFGRIHYREFEQLPVYFGEVRAGRT